MIWEHKIAIEEVGIDPKNFPKSLKTSLHFLDDQIKKVDAGNEAEMLKLHKRSIVLAEEVQNFSEEFNNLTENNMLKDEELKRAQAVGLDENATIEQVQAAEKEAADKADIERANKEAADLEAANKEAAEKEKANKEALDKEAKEKADKEAANKKEAARLQAIADEEEEDGLLGTGI